MLNGLDAASQPDGGKALLAAKAAIQQKAAAVRERYAAMERANFVLGLAHIFANTNHQLGPLVQASGKNVSTRTISFLTP